jgi:D-Tyr-tRNAtyr deacylase
MIMPIPRTGTNVLSAVENQKKPLKNIPIMDKITEYRYIQAYNRLENEAIDDIDAAVFTGDMFMLEANRIKFREIMDRWESKLIQLEQICEMQQ